MKEGTIIKTYHHFLVIIMMFAAAGLFGEGFQLLFLDGDADVQKNGRWEPLFTGDELPEDSMIRLESGAIAEFAGPRDTLLFSSQGTYRLTASSVPPAVSGNSAVSSIFNRIVKAGREPDRSRSQVMGVRGSEAVTGAEFTWVDEDSLNFEEALEAFRAEDYQRTLEILEAAADPVGKQLAYYLLGFSRLQQGGKEEGTAALREAVSIDADRNISGLARQLLP